MASLYCTADKIGMVSGGGIVTKNEVIALQGLGDVLALGEGDVKASSHGMADDPFLTDYIAEDLVEGLLASRKFELAQFYAGTFTKTVRRLKRAGVRVSYTAAAHDRTKSREEYEKLGLPYNYPHMVNPKLLDMYVNGYREADIVICPSTLSATIMREEFGCKNVQVVPHGVDLPEKTKPPPKKFEVAYLGQPGPDKGLLYLLKAWKRLRYRDVRLVIAGKGTSVLSSLYRAYGGGNVYIKGFVPSISEVYDACSVYVQPSVTEGFGIEILEAMAHGRPVIAAEGAGAAELIDPGITGFVVPIRDWHAIADRIDHMKRHPAQTFLMGRAARKRAEDFTWNKIWMKYQQAWTA